MTHSQAQSTTDLTRWDTLTEPKIYPTNSPLPVETSYFMYSISSSGVERATSA